MAMSAASASALPVAVLGSGSVTGAMMVTSLELDRRFGREPGTTQTRSGVRSRYWVDDTQTSSLLAAQAVERALEMAGLAATELDAVVVASVLPERPMPTTAVLVLRHLGVADGGVFATDVNTSCLGFLTGLEVAGIGIAAGRWRHVAVAAVDISSPGLDHDDLESSAIFGDGAGAVVLGPAVDGERILATRFATYSSGAELCRIDAGGTRWNVTKPPPSNRDYLFHMDGIGLMRIVAKRLPTFIADLLTAAGTDLAGVDVVVPHQASGLGLRFLTERAGVPREKVIDILADHGNQVSASLPTALDHALRSGRLRPGQTAMLLGTGAGVVIGGVVIRR
jgi:3-oxoacyl-[acyl-carrier-protein] synthase III